MRHRDKVTAKVLAGVLALLATVQPAFALYCSCDCVATADNCCQDACEHDKDLAPKCKSCKSGHCHGKLKKGIASKCPSRKKKSDDGLARKSLPIHPCQCPQGCDCHLRHVIRIGIVQHPEALTSLDLSEVSHVEAAGHECETISATASIYLTHHPAHERSALALCALLCRFAS